MNGCERRMGILVVSATVATPLLPPAKLTPRRGMSLVGLVAMCAAPQQQQSPGLANASLRLLQRSLGAGANMAQPMGMQMSQAGGMGYQQPFNPMAPAMGMQMGMPGALPGFDPFAANNMGMPMMPMGGGMMAPGYSPFGGMGRGGHQAPGGYNPFGGKSGGGGGGGDGGRGGRGGRGRGDGGSNGGGGNAPGSNRFAAFRG